MQPYVNIFLPCALPAQRPVGTGKLPMHTCDQELSDHCDWLSQQSRDRNAHLCLPAFGTS